MPPVDREHHYLHVPVAPGKKGDGAAFYWCAEREIDTTEPDAHTGTQLEDTAERDKGSQRHR